MRLADVNLTLHTTRQPSSGDTRGTPHKYVKNGMDGGKQDPLAVHHEYA